MRRTILIHVGVTILSLLWMYVFWSYIQWRLDWMDVWNWNARERGELSVLCTVVLLSTNSFVAAMRIK